MKKISVEDLVDVISDSKDNYVELMSKYESEKISGSLNKELVALAKIEGLKQSRHWLNKLLVLTGQEEIK